MADFSPGKKQAKNFIHTVPNKEELLPPVIDFEFYGDKKQNPPSKEVVLKELDDLVSEIEAYYKKRPIIYVTRSTYDLYIKGSYEAYPIWMLSLVFKPKDMKWCLWQYASWGKLKGYSGQEEYIDLNVFNGSKEDFEKFISACQVSN